LARVVAMRRSQDTATSSPAPSAKPSIRAITGTGNSRRQAQVRCTTLM
jgi:hypothetical protein